MANRTPATERVTLALRLADGSIVPVEADAVSLQFIGRYSRLPAFGPLGSRLKVHLIAQG